MDGMRAQLDQMMALLNQAHAEKAQEPAPKAKTTR
jgi:hypothetical protein